MEIVFIRYLRPKVRFDSRMYPCFVNGDVFATNLTDMIYMGIVDKQLTVNDYSFESFQNSKKVCSYTEMTTTRICENVDSELDIGNEIFVCFHFLSRNRR